MYCIEEVDEKTVCEALEKKNWKVIDTRDSNTFIGWRLNGEEKRGHIPGATDYAAEWIQFPFTNPWVKEEEQKKRFEQKLIDKGITKDKSLILYDYTGEDAPVIAEFLKKRGYDKLYYFNFHNWTRKTIWPPNYKKMVPVQWVKDVMDGKCPETYSGGDYRIFDVAETDDPYPEFVERHIPGSAHISVNEFQNSESWSTVSDEKLIEFACNNGITVDTTVILYAEGYTGAIHVLACVLEYMGVDVRCINGSNYQWIWHGYETEAGNPPKVPVKSFGASIPEHPESIVKLEEAREITSKKQKAQMVDMRPWEQYTGQTSGYPYFDKAGRLPNVIWCSEEYYYLNPDETIGNPEEMLEHWKSCGIDLDERIVFYCGSGAW